MGPHELCVPLITDFMNVFISVLVFLLMMSVGCTSIVDKEFEQFIFLVTLRNRHGTPYQTIPMDSNGSSMDIVHRPD
jgi:hypothetical protein